MQSAKTYPSPSFAEDSSAPTAPRIGLQSAAARRARRVEALNDLTPQLETLSAQSKAAGLGLIAYFLDMAVYEAKHEQEIFSPKI